MFYAKVDRERSEVYDMLIYDSTSGLVSGVHKLLYIRTR